MFKTIFLKLVLLKMSVYLHTLEPECHNYTKYDLLKTSSQRSWQVEYSSIEIIYNFVYARPNTINFLSAVF